MSKADAQAWVYAELDRLHPPPKADIVLSDEDVQKRTMSGRPEIDPPPPEVSFTGLRMTGSPAKAETTRVAPKDSFGAAQPQEMFAYRRKLYETTSRRLRRPR